MLMERVVCLCKQSSRFSFWGPENASFAEFWNPRIRGHLAFYNSFSAFWRLQNAIFAQSWNPGFKGTKLRVSKFPAFWQPENAISTDSWNQRFKVPRKECRNFLHLWDLKIRYYRVVKSTFQGYQDSCEQIFRILVKWKCDFCRFVKPMF